MRRKSALFVLLCLALFDLGTPVHGAPSIDEAGFLALAGELAPKVNLFHDVWAQDPDAQFFGGTSRDFLYWVKRQLKNGVTPEALRGLPFIDVRDFIVRDSDVDVVSAKRLGLSASAYGVKRIDYISPNRFDPATEEGRTERDQGYIPVEKIRLAKDGVIRDGGFGNGAAEIWSGRLTVRHADPEMFWKTGFAKAGRNHPVLLALRYLRQLAANYHSEHGAGAPAKGWLHGLDPASVQATRKIIADAVHDPALSRLLASPEFALKLNETVHKAFRSYTNPTAALEIYRHLGADALVSAHDVIEPINQYLFARPPLDAATVRARFLEYGVSDGSAIVKPLLGAVPGGKLYHGTKTEEAFESILFTGILPSSEGNAGGGLYVVPRDSLQFAAEWGGSPDRLVAFDVRPSANYVDITGGAGKRLFDAFRAKTGKGESEFASYFGIDALKYPYEPWNALVIKNSAALGFPEGHTRPLFRGVSKFLHLAASVKSHSDLARLLDLMKRARLTEGEADQILDTAGSALGDSIKKARLDRVRSVLSGRYGEITDVIGFYDALDAYRETASKGGATAALEAEAIRRLEALLSPVRQRTAMNMRGQLTTIPLFPRDALSAASTVGSDPVVKGLAAGLTKANAAFESEWIRAWMAKQPRSDATIAALRAQYRKVFTLPCAVVATACAGLGAGLLYHWFRVPELSLLGLPIGAFVFYNTYVDGWNKRIAARSLQLRLDLFSGAEWRAIERAIQKEEARASGCLPWWRRLLP